MRAGALAVIVIVALVASLVGGGGHPRHRARAAATAAAAAPVVPPAIPANWRQLALDLDRAQAIIDNPASATALLVAAGRFEQLATVALGQRSAAERHAVVSALGLPARRTMIVNLQATVALSHLVSPRRALPPWKVIQPPSAATLLGYFKAAQGRFGVRWEHLAAIEFIETKFGRVAGTSPAGAQGPMQFMPATWAQYGRGDIHNPRDAIFAAARYLAANGAPGDIAAALYHYNPSLDYVHAVRAYATRMATDPRAYYGYYGWQVIYHRVGGLVILPVGYPKVRPVAVAPLLGRH